MNKKNDQKILTISGHLAELRTRLIICVLAWLGVAVLVFSKVKLIYHYIQYGYIMEYLYLSPSDYMGVSLDTAFSVALVIIFPLIVFHIWRFVEPAVEMKNRRQWRIMIFFGVVLLYIGGVFSFFIVVPNMLQFFITFSDSTSKLQFEMQKYLHFVLSTTLIFGLIFEVPLMMTLLAQLGLLHLETIQRYQKYIIVFIFVFAAIVTPPDALSQILMAIPLLLLVQLGTFLVKLVERRKNV
jgi:twin arginine-targeting protein translocase tatC